MDSNNSKNLIQIVAGSFDQKKILNDFIEVPFQIYSQEAAWVPPLRIAMKDLLNPKKHPFFKTGRAIGFIAYKNQKMVGRVAAVQSYASNKFHENQTGFFGFLDCIDDLEVLKN